MKAGKRPPAADAGRGGRGRRAGDTGRPYKAKQPGRSLTAGKCSPVTVWKNARRRRMGRARSKDRIPRGRGDVKGREKIFRLTSFGKSVILRPYSSNAMKGRRQFQGLFQRAAGWCEAVRRELRHWPLSSRAERRLPLGADGRCPLSCRRDSPVSKGPIVLSGRVSRQ